MIFPTIHQKVISNKIENYLFILKTSHGIISFNLTKKKKELVSDLERFDFLCSDPENIKEICLKTISEIEYENLLKEGN